MTQSEATTARREALLAEARAHREGATIYALARALGRPYRRVFDAVKRLADEGLLHLQPTARSGRRALLVRVPSSRRGCVQPLPEFLSAAERGALHALGARMALLGRRVRELRLFGSRARGVARWDSDFDLAVRVQGRRDPALERAIIAAFADVEWGAPLEGALRISPLVLFEAERPGPVGAAIERDGISVWKASA